MWEVTLRQGACGIHRVINDVLGIHHHRIRYQDPLFSLLRYQYAIRSIFVPHTFCHDPPTSGSPKRSPAFTTTYAHLQRPVHVKLHRLNKLSLTRSAHHTCQPPLLILTPISTKISSSQKVTLPRHVVCIKP